MEILKEDKSYCYYRSPIGFIEIKCAGEIITQLEFTNQEDIELFYPENKLLVNCVQQLEEYFNAKRKKFTIPFDQSGTEFQQKTWQLIQEIPFGKTWSYTELAKKSGNLNNIRAAAKANSKNKLAILVPCHRVIGNNDQLVGYAWELWRKKWLLEHESKIENGTQTLF